VKSVSNSKISCKDIIWERVREDDCFGCGCWKCEGEYTVAPYSCVYGECEWKDEMCPECPVRAMFS
jgi:hypothetical protein